MNVGGGISSKLDRAQRCLLFTEPYSKVHDPHTYIKEIPIIVNEFPSRLSKCSGEAYCRTQVESYGAIAQVR